MRKGYLTPQEGHMGQTRAISRPKKEEEKEATTQGHLTPWAGRPHGEQASWDQAKTTPEGDTEQQPHKKGGEIKNRQGRRHA